MKKIVINRCFGGFGLSEEALKLLGTESYMDYDEDRENPKLIEVVEKLGAAANGGYSKLRIVEIPEDVEYTIEEYDGVESIHEKHRSWK
jgi:hypothetical protein